MVSRRTSSVGDVAELSRPTNAGASEGSSLSSRARRLISIVEAVVVILAGAVIVGCLIVLGVLVADPGRGEEWTTGLRPVNFYRELDAELLDDYAGTFAVAHNSGDSVEATLEALGRGADVIEVDVVAVEGRLYAAHGVPVNWVGNRLFRGPPLERVWIASAAADAIKLDLKDSSPEFQELLLRFLAARSGQRRVIVVSSDVAMLQQLATERPEVIRLLSVGSTGGFRSLEENPDLLPVVDGVSVRHTLIDEERAGWLEERGLLTLAWTVNDLTRVNELVMLGVDAITTDNLAIMTLLGGQERTENPLDQLRRPAEPELTGGER
jgi:hypothetical protein